MKTISVLVREDHLETLAKTKPMTALAELIWNALDAEATEVRVEFIANEMEGLETIRIVDNGHGLHYEDALIVFQNLGGSWKRAGFKTHARKRVLHGKYGKGRFRAFSLGSAVTWKTSYEEAGRVYSYTIQGHGGKLGEFQVANITGTPGEPTGMVVEIADTPDAAGLLQGVKALQEATDIFALYLRQYPDTHIIYDGTPLDPINSELESFDYDLEEMVMENGERVTAELSIVEWNLPGKRGVYLCDEHGFMLQNALPRLHFRGFSYTAYLKSAYVPILERDGLLEAGDLATDTRQLLDAARAKLREHFTLREAEKARDTLAQWCEQGIYPYPAEVFSDSEANERRIFDIYATHLNQIHPEFATASPTNKHLILKLIQELVRAEPTRVARVLDAIVEFPVEKEGEVAEIIGG